MRARAEYIGNHQPNHDCNKCVEDEQKEKLAGQPSFDVRRHQGADNRQQDQRRGEGAQQSQNNNSRLVQLSRVPGVYEQSRCHAKQHANQYFEI